jgi:hypothetical protein
VPPSSGRSVDLCNGVITEKTSTWNFSFLGLFLLSPFHNFVVPYMNLLLSDTELRMRGTVIPMLFITWCSGTGTFLMYCIPHGGKYNGLVRVTKLGQ